MKTIILTGYDERQFHEIAEREEDAGCYLCKRSGKGIFLVKDGGEEGMGRSELSFKWFSHIGDNKEFMFALCNECHMLLRTFVEKVIFEREFGKQLEPQLGKEKE